MTRRIVTSIVLPLVFLAGCRPAAEPVGAVEAAAAETPAEVGTAAVSPSGKTRPTPAGSGERASARDPLEEAARRDMFGLANTVAGQGDAHALALAALIRSSALPEREGEDPGPPDPLPEMDETVRDWLDAAERQAPDDVVALIVAINLERYDDTRRKALIARWRALEPGNLVPVLLADLPGAEMLDAISKASVYDTHYDDFLRTMFRTASRSLPAGVVRAQALRVGMAPQAFLASMAIGNRAVDGMPWFPRLTGACLPERVPDPLRAHCLRAAGVMLDHGDDLMSEILGARIVARHSANSAERRDAVERGRLGRWLSQQSTNVYLNDPQHYFQRLAQVLGGDHAFTEQALMRQFVVEAGLPPVPPPGWQPDQNH